MLHFGTPTCTTLPSNWRGARCSAAPCSSPSRCRWCCRLTRKLRLRPDTHAAHVREVLKNFVPVAISRGVVQISAYVDQALATLVGEGAMAAMTTAQSIYMLPVSLFGMAVSAAELPAMSSAVGTEAEIALRLRGRLECRPAADRVLHRAFGDGVLRARRCDDGGALSSTGNSPTRIPCTSGESWRARRVGLLASTLGRLYASTYYALRDTRTPLRYASVRVALTIGLGYLCALPLAPVARHRSALGRGGLTASAGVAGWVEFTLLRRTLNARIGAHRRSGVADRQAVDFGGGWRGGGVGHQTRGRESGSSRRDGAARSVAVRPDLLRRRPISCEWKSAPRCSREWPA